MFAIIVDFAQQKNREANNCRRHVVNALTYRPSIAAFVETCPAGAKKVARLPVREPTSKWLRVALRIKRHHLQVFQLLTQT